jgi:hypothetical protein
MSPVGLGTKNHYAGEGQQQFSSQSKEIKKQRQIELVGPLEELDEFTASDCGPNKFLLPVEVAYKHGQIILEGSLNETKEKQEAPPRRREFECATLKLPAPGIKTKQMKKRLGCAVAHAASRWLPTAAARVRAQVRSCGIYGGKSGTGANFLRVLRFLLPILIPPTAPFSSIIRDLYNRAVSGRRTKWTQSHPTSRN